MFACGTIYEPRISSSHGGLIGLIDKDLPKQLSCESLLFRNLRHFSCCPGQIPKFEKISAPKKSLQDLSCQIYHDSLALLLFHLHLARQINRTQTTPSCNTQRSHLILARTATCVNFKPSTIFTPIATNCMSGSSSHCDSAFESADGSSRGSSSPTRSSLDLVEQHFVSHLKAGFSTGTEDCRPIVSTLRASSLHTQQRIPIQYRRSHSSSTPYCDDADSDNSDSDEMEATARAIRALAPSRRRPYQTISRSSTLLTTPVSALFRPQVCMLEACICTTSLLSSSSGISWVRPCVHL